MFATMAKKKEPVVYTSVPLERSVDTEVMVIKARNRGKGIDPKSKPLVIADLTEKALEVKRIIETDELSDSEILDKIRKIFDDEK